MQIAVTTAPEQTKAMLHSSPAASATGEKGNFSKIFQERAKEENNSSRSPEKNNVKPGEGNGRQNSASSLSISVKSARLSALERFLYDLVYRDPAAWSRADQASYHVGEGNGKLPAFFPQGQTGNGQGKSFLPELGKFSGRQDSHRSALSSDSSSLLAAELQSALSSKSLRADDFETSLQEIEQKDRVREGQILRELVQKFAVRKLEQGMEVDGTLNPSVFGDVSFNVSLKNNHVTVKFFAKDEAVAKLFETNLEILRKALRQHGLTVDLLATENYQKQKGEKSYV